MARVQTSGPAPQIASGRLLRGLPLTAGKPAKTRELRPAPQIASGKAPSPAGTATNVGLTRVGLKKRRLYPDHRPAPISRVEQTRVPNRRRYLAPPPHCQTRKHRRCRPPRIPSYQDGTRHGCRPSWPPRDSLTRGTAAALTLIAHGTAAPFARGPQRRPQLLKSNKTTERSARRGCWIKSAEADLRGSSVHVHYKAVAKPRFRGGTILGRPATATKTLRLNVSPRPPETAVLGNRRC